MEDNLFSEENRRHLSSLKRAEEARIKLYGKPRSNGASVLSFMILNWEDVWKEDQEKKKEQPELAALKK